jgi:uncharacterized phiE125 gp8 family phage protein
MSLYLVTAPAAEPVSLADVKLHLRVDSTAEDDLIAGLITAARDYLEAFTRRAIPRQTWDWKLDAFPCGSEFYLPKAPCASVTSITYIDTDGTSQTLATSVYDTDLPTGPMARAGRVFLKYQQVWPQTRSIPNAVTVRFVAGYADSATDPYPDMLKICIKEHVRAHYGRGVEDRDAILQWIHGQAWPYVSV